MSKVCCFIGHRRIDLIKEICYNELYKLPII